MFKKLTVFLFIFISSLQAIQIPSYLDLDNLVQESYDIAVQDLKKASATSFLPKKSITDQLAQIHWLTLFTIIQIRSRICLTALAFCNNTQSLESLKNLFQKEKACLIGVDNTIEQEIKDAFNVKTEPTIIYYKDGQEIARSTNFNNTQVTQYIKQNKSEAKFENINSADIAKIIGSAALPTFSDYRTLQQEFYNLHLETCLHFGCFDFIPKKPITDELIQARFLAFSAKITCCSMFKITAAIFYNNTQKLESLKKFAAQPNNSLCLIGADINKTEQEIKNVFNITTEPTIIYYVAGQEMARSTNFDVKDVEQHIIDILTQLSKPQDQKIS